MKVLFINPNNVPALNIGLAYVMSAVEEENEIKLLDLGLCGKDFRETVSGYLNNSADVVAFSTFTHNFGKALEVASFIKQRFPRPKVIFGGIHPTLCPEEVIACPEVDAICIGEGEGALKEYLDSLARDSQPFVKGIWFKDKYGGIIRNSVRPFQKEIDSLRFPNWDHWDMEYYIKYVDMEKVGFIASRGCPFSCTFCSNPALRRAMTGDFVRTRDPEQVIDEIELNFSKYGKHGFKHVRFDDEVFGLDREFLIKFCALYVKKGLNRRLPWFCQTRADLLTDEYADLIAQAGCAIVGLGVETGDDLTRSKVYNKCISNETIIEATARLKKRNVSYLFYMIYNAPHTDRREREKTLKIVKDLNPLRATFSPFMYLPKTELGNNFSVEVAPRITNQPMGKAGIRYKTSKLLSLAYVFQRGRNSFRSGLRLKGLVFIWDIVKFIPRYLFCYRGKSFSWSGFEKALFQLEYFTLFKYAISNSRKNLK